MLKKFLYKLKSVVFMPEKKIIAFANQKGGVGKSTLCMLFAHTLAESGIPVKILDYDRQHTIGNRRSDDIRRFTSQDPESIIRDGTDVRFRFEVLSSGLFTPDDVSNDIRALLQDSSNLLVDAPGNLLEPGLTTLFANADYIIVPFQFEPGSINSTALFINYCYKLKQGSYLNAQLIFVPNQYRTRSGTDRERQNWAHAAEVFSKYGIVVDPIPDSIELQRVNTLGLKARQRGPIKNAFEQIGKIIFGDEFKPSIECGGSDSVPEKTDVKTENDISKANTPPNRDEFPQPAAENQVAQVCGSRDESN